MSGPPPRKCEECGALLFGNVICNHRGGVKRLPEPPPNRVMFENQPVPLWQWLLFAVVFVVSYLFVTQWLPS